MFNEDYCPIFHVGDSVTIVTGSNGYILSTVNKINKTSYRVDDRLFYKTNLVERKKRQKWDRVNYITLTTTEQKNEVLKRKYVAVLLKTHYSKLSLDVLQEIYKLIKENGIC